jgi:hypothetical protein
MVISILPLTRAQKRAFLFRPGVFGKRSSNRGSIIRVSQMTRGGVLEDRSRVNISFMIDLRRWR